MQELQRVQYITVHFRHLQGLRILPWFLWMIAFSAVNPLLGLPQGRLDYQLVILVLGLPAAWLSARWIGDSYDRRFGLVRGLQDSEQRLSQTLITTAFCAILFIAFIVDSMARWPVNLAALTVSAFYLVGWWSTGRIRHHYLVIAALFVVSSTVLPLITMQWPLVGDFALPIVIGLLFTIGSLMDHLMLVRALKPMPEEG